MDLTASITDGTAQPLVLLAAALLLGALHGLEPGHSKTMMAAFIIAVRGTVGQAVLLGLSAALSHTAVVWVLALIALRLGDEAVGEEMEPYFMMASGGIILLIAFWMVFRTWRATSHGNAHGQAQAHGPGHHHDHGHHHHDHSHGHDHRGDRHGSR